MAESTRLPASERRVPAGAPDDPVYRPLPVLAIVGFVLGCFYLFFLAWSWLVSVFRGTPLDLSVYLLILPLAGLLCSLVAWLQIRHAEGALAGASMTQVGMVGNGLLALIYLAFLAGSYFAVAGKAREFTLEWLEKIRSGQVDSAFLSCLEPSERPREDARLHEALEVRFNTTQDPNRTGPYATFRNSELVRFIQRSGEETTFLPAGLRDWKYQEGGYRVRQNVKAVSPEGTLNIVLTLHGRDTPGKAAGWTIIWNESNVQEEDVTDRGKLHLALMGQALSFVTEASQKWAAGKLPDAFLSTVAPEQRDVVRTAYHAQVALATVAGNAAPEVDDLSLDSLRTCESYLPGFRSFTHGSLVADLDESFWAPEKVRPRTASEVRKLFQHPADAMARYIRVDTLKKPNWRKDGDRFQVLIDCQVIVHPNFVADGVLLVETDANNLAAATDQPVPWRIARLDLIRAKSLDSFLSTRQ